MKNDDEYEVGYGKPPKDGQFKTGMSGNPKGRPKGVKNFQTELEAVLRSRVTLTHAGKPKSVGTIEAALLRLKEKALKGDQRALELLLAYAQGVSESANARLQERHLSNLEEEILDRYALSRGKDDLNESDDE